MKTYSVAVVATMSAGKSSLLNSLMGMELLPSQNEACTATVFKITDHDELKHFVGRYYADSKWETKGGVSRLTGEWSDWVNVNKAILQKWNQQGYREIELHGNVPNIANTPAGVRLCFIDTPGPNNARSEEHRRITQQVISSNDFSTLIFVINASVAGVRDEYKLLFALKDQLAKRDEKAQIIFALNKIDLLDQDRGESLSRTVRSIREYLEKEIGFEKPLVIPVCSALAGSIRQVLASHRRLTVRQLAQLRGEKLSAAKLRTLPRRKRSRLHYVCTLPLRLQEGVANLLEQFRQLPAEYHASLALNPQWKEISGYPEMPLFTPTRQVWIGGRFYAYRELFELEKLTGVPWLEKIIAHHLASLTPGLATEDNETPILTQWNNLSADDEKASEAAEEPVQLPVAKQMSVVISPETTGSSPFSSVIRKSNHKGSKKMLSISLTYNPYLVTTKFSMDGEELPPEHKFYTTASGRLQNWIDNLLPELFDEYREKTLCIDFTGTEYDWEDVLSAIKTYNEKTGAHFTATPHLSGAGEDRIKKIINLYNEGLESPFKELFESAEMRAAFERATDPIFEANVIATMSSGKSTVVNALLGQELMPAKNEACTATLAQITDDDSMVGKGFIAQQFDRQGKPLSGEEKATRELLTQWNDDPQTHLIKMRGDIPTIDQTDAVTLRITDTPGPNNARNAEHQKATLEAIQSKPLSMVIYVLNATQLSTNDDNSLLKTVCAEMSKGGRQAHDRFVFIANKIDAFDPEKGESVKSALEHVRQYLRDHGIVNPIVIPASAQLAKMLRLPEESLTRSERGNLRTQVELFTQEKEMNMLDHSRSQLSAACVARLEKRLKAATDAKDERAVAEILSGIPIVEELLNDFLQKHAIPAKLKDAVDTFNRVMQQSVIAQAMNEQLGKSEEELAQVISSIKHLTQDKDNIKMAKDFREKVKKINYSLSQEAEDKIAELNDESEKLIEKMNDDLDEDKTSPEKAKHLVEDAIQRCQGLEAQVNVELTNALNREYISVIEKLRDEYQEYAAKVINENFPEDGGLRTLQKAAMEMPSVSEMIMDASHSEQVKVKKGKERRLVDTEKVVVGQEEYVAGYKTERYGFLWLKKREVPIYKWRDKFELREVYKDVDVFETEERKYVDLKTIRRKVSNAIRKFSKDNFEKFRENATNNVEKAKQTLLDLMKVIDDRIKEVANQLEQAEKSQQEKERIVEDNRRKFEWFTKFKAKVESVLAI